MEPISRLTPATVDVLAVLLSSSEPVWGLLIVKETGRPAGSVYPILERLERLGWASSEWESENERNGPRRRLYQLTRPGAVAAPAAIERGRSRAQRAAGFGKGATA